MKKPNILFILSDQQRWDTCGCYGQRLNITPNLDNMAREGTRFENAFTCQPVCGPARACIQTGKYPTQIGCHTNHRMLPIGEKTIAHHLSEAGYETAYIGKWHLASFGPTECPDNYETKAVPPQRRGGYKDFWLASDILEFTSHSYDGHMFDSKGRKREFPKGRYRVDVETDWVIEYLQNRKTKKPFFLFVSYIEPHHQNDHGHYEGPHGSKQKFKNFVAPKDLQNAEGDWRIEYPDYLGCVNSLDTNLGPIRDVLHKLGIADNTVIIYTSDHGSHFRTRNSEYKRSCHDASIRIPMIIFGQGFVGGVVRNELVSLINLPPTVLTCAGIKPPQYMQGRPLQELVAGNTRDWQKEIFIQISESQCGRAIRTEKWKYSVFAPDKTGQDASSDKYIEEYLYDLVNDPHEQNNLIKIPETKSVRSELRSKLKILMKKAGEKEPVIEENQ